MLITLVNPPLFGTPTPPYSLVLLGTVAEAQGHRVRIVDFNLWKTFDPDAMIETVLAGDPDVIGFTCWGNTVPFCASLASAIRAIADVWLLVGGPMVRADWGRFPELRANFDILVEGEGEEVFPRILAEIDGSKPVQGAPSGRLVRAETPEIGVVPLPNWSLLGDLSPYRLADGTLQLPIQASRGCAYNCSFCSVREFWGAVRLRKPEVVIAEIRANIECYGADTFLFYDDNFTGDSAWVRALTGLFRSSLPRFRWVASTRVDLVPPDLAIELAEAGAVNLFFGIESASEQIRKLYRKSFRVDVLDVLRRIAETGIAAEVSLVFGSPADGPDVLAANLDFIDGCLGAGVSYLHTHLLFPLPGTVVSRQYADAVIANPYPRVTQASLAHTPDAYFNFLEGHREDCPDFWMFRPRDMSIEQFFEGFFEAVFRKGQFVNLPQGLTPPAMTSPPAPKGMASHYG